MEIIEKGVINDKALTIDIGNVCVLNVLEPSTEGVRNKYQLIASKVLKMCGLRPKITYYPIPSEVARRKEMVPYYFVCLAICRQKKMIEGKGISIIKDLAGMYRLHPENRSEILRKIYQSEGKPGIQAFVRVLGDKSAEPYINWVKVDSKNSKRSRQGQKIITIGNPPAPLGDKFNFKDIFEEMSLLTGSKIGRQGGKRSISSAQAWDAKNGGGK